MKILVLSFGILISMASPCVLQAEDVLHVGGAIEYIRNMDYPFFAVEEPLPADDYLGCLKLYNALNIPVILDESFKRKEQFESIRKNPEAPSTVQSPQRSWTHEVKTGLRVRETIQRVHPVG